MLYSPGYVSGALRYDLKGAYDYYPSGKLLRMYPANDVERYLTTQNERDVESGYDFRNARFSDSEIGGIFRQVDPLASEFLDWSPYNYAADNPILNADPSGLAPTDFLDKEGNKIAHVEDGSNAVFQLTGTNQTNEYFKFKEYSAQGGKDQISVEGAITGAQDYVTNNYTKCNQSVNFVGRTYESATAADGKTVENIGNVTGNSLARDITANLKTLTAEKSVATAQESAGKGNLVVGANGGHVVTMTTKTFDVTHYNSGVAGAQKQIVGGKTANVNGSVRPTNIGPNKSNSFQNPNYSGMTWYSFPAK